MANSTNRTAGEVKGMPMHHPDPATAESGGVMVKAVRRAAVVLRYLCEEGWRPTLARALGVLIRNGVIKPRLRLAAGWHRLLGLQLGRSSHIDWTVHIVGHRNIRIGDGFYMDRQAQLRSMAASGKPGATPKLTIGNNVRLRYGAAIDANHAIQIGDNTTIGPYSLIIDNNHNFSDRERPIRDQGVTYRPVRIEEDCWIGAHVIVLPGVTIGRHSVIAANSTVTRDIPPFVVAGGSPARVLKEI